MNPRSICKMQYTVSDVNVEDDEKVTSESIIVIVCVCTSPASYLLRNNARPNVYAPSLHTRQKVKRRQQSTWWRWRRCFIVTSKSRWPHGVRGSKTRSWKRPVLHAWASKHVPEYAYKKLSWSICGGINYLQTDRAKSLANTGGQ